MGDSQLVVKALNSREEIKGEYENVIEDVRVLMTYRLNWGVRFVYRKANIIAHNLSKLAFSFLMRWCG